MKKIYFLSYLFCFLVFSCKSKQFLSNNNELIIRSKTNIETQNTNLKIIQINDTTFVNLKDYDADFVYDMKYATNDNFLKSKVYDCADCFLRLKTAKALINANSEFKKIGYKIKIYDCYRPLDVQKKMWQIISNPNFVANPARGSIHNRGGAVDISLTDFSGNELNMGTVFDFFGVEAGHDYIQFPDYILKNRQLLKNIMLQYGFNSFDSEWWHYNLKSALNDKISNEKWKCN